MKPAPSDVLVFFGSTGDLAFKQIFPALQALVRHGRLDMPIVAVGRKDLPIEELRTRAKESISKNGGLDAAAFAKLSSQLRYVKVDYNDAATFARIREAIGPAKHPLHYVALPPELFETVATSLAKAGLNEGARLSLEKPFGSSQASALALSKTLHRYFPEESIFRIDHFLGKESVENLIYFRAANPLIEASLHRDHIASVEITMAETFGVKGRARFYDAVGAVRDVVQNHLLEVVACLAMELPTSKGAAGLRGARGRLLTQVRALSGGDIVRGQVRGYTDEEGVAKGSEHRDLRRASTLHRLAAMAGRALLHPHRQVVADDRHRGDDPVEARGVSGPRRALPSRAELRSLSSRPRQRHRAGRKREKGRRDVRGRTSRARSAPLPRRTR